MDCVTDWLLLAVLAAVEFCVAAVLLDWVCASESAKAGAKFVANVNALTTNAIWRALMFILFSSCTGVHY